MDKFKEHEVQELNAVVGGAEDGIRFSAESTTNAEGEVVMKFDITWDQGSKNISSN